MSEEGGGGGREEDVCLRRKGSRKIWAGTRGGVGVCGEGIKVRTRGLR